ncbi:MAG TPA: histidine phosphatase family protein [Candidatus Baltobacteraceae bacterium]|nr:histidine phosphatase family protein [Candidatus Baltobacteraceae bacterium]
MKLVIFVRHGQSEANVGRTLSNDVNRNPLTPLGVSQAESAAAELKRLSKLSSFFTSPVLRAVQTANIIAKDFDLLPKVDERLMERGFGSFNNKKFESTEAMGKYMKDEISSNYPLGLESWTSLKSRTKAFMGGLPDGISIAVSHRDPIAASLAGFEKRYDDDMLSAQDLKIPTASMTILDLQAKRIIAIGSDKLPAI